MNSIISYISSFIFTATKQQPIEEEAKVFVDSLLKTHFSLKPQTMNSILVYPFFIQNNLLYVSDVVGPHPNDYIELFNCAKEKGVYFFDNFENKYIKGYYRKVADDMVGGVVWTIDKTREGN